MISIYDFAVGGFIKCATDREFQRYRDNILCRACRNNIQKFDDDMFYQNGVHHGIVIVGEMGRDGLFVTKEGGEYARYRLENAMDIVEDLEFEIMSRMLSVGIDINKAYMGLDTIDTEDELDVGIVFIK